MAAMSPEQRPSPDELVEPLQDGYRITATGLLQPLVAVIQRVAPLEREAVVPAVVTVVMPMMTVVMLGKHVHPLPLNFSYLRNGPHSNPVHRKRHKTLSPAPG
jgi:hypothetical protein